MSLSREKISRKASELGRRNPAYQELCSLIAEILLAATPPETETASPPPAKGNAETPWDLASLELDWPAIWKGTETLAQTLAERPEGAQAAACLVRLREEANGRAGLLRAILFEDAQRIKLAAQAESVEPAVLQMALGATLRPWLVSAAQAAAQNLDLNSWTHGHCPVCGSPPGLAELAPPNGARFLHCRLCETRWPHQRMGCPFCSNQDMDEMVFLQGEDEQGVRVEICHKCGRHLKTLDLRELAGPVVFPLDDAATWHLDVIARKYLEERESG